LRAENSRKEFAMSHDTNRSSDESRRTGRRDPDVSRTAGAIRDGDGQPDSRDAAAQSLGFRSYVALVAASTPITARDGRVHLIVESHDGRWIVWREEAWPEYRTFDSIHHAGRAAGEEEP
jgi:hypothetical protein